MALTLFSPVCYGTTTVHDADKPLCAMAVMMAVPELTALILPLVETVAMFGSLETHVTALYLAFLG